MLFLLWFVSVGVDAADAALAVEFVELQKEHVMCIGLSVV